MPIELVDLRKAIFNVIDLEGVTVTVDPDFKKKRENALDALLNADPKDPSAFRTAIISHKTFWKSFHGMGSITDCEVKLTHWDSDFYINSTDPSNPFSVLHQLAAEKRVALGLQRASKDTLTNILVNNREECRAYLASKSKLFSQLDTIPGWKPDISVGLGAKPQNNSTALLTDNAIDNIKKGAGLLLLRKLIANSNDLDKLKALSEADNTDKIRTAAQALGFPPAGLETLVHLSILDEVNEQLDKRIDQVTANQGFEMYVQKLGQQGKPGLLSQKKLLEKDDDEFKDELSDLLEIDLADGDIPWAKGLLGTRFLQAYLPTHEKTELKKILNTAINSDDMISQINTALGYGNDYDYENYVDDAVTEKNLNVFRMAMTQGILSQAFFDTDQKAMLDVVNAKDFDGFKKGLKLLGITNVDWIKSGDMTEIQQSVRSQIFEIEVSKRTSLGATVHPKLLEAFKKLPAEKQIAIMLKPEDIPHILHAKDVGAVRHYLGQNITDSVANEIVKENKRLVLFSAIHNSKVASILANMQPPITLDQTKISAINEALDQVKIASDNPNQYIALIDNIKKQNPGVKKEVFNELFGLKPELFGLKPDLFALLKADGVSLDAESKVLGEIINQQNNNQSILAAYEYYSSLDASRTAMKNFWGALLSIEKINPPITPARVQKIESAFREANTLNQFIASAFSDIPNPLSSDEQKLKDGLTNEFTSAVFNQLKFELRKENLVNPDPVKANASLKKIEDLVQIIHKEQKSVTQSKRDEYKPLRDVNPIHLINPSFQGKVKNDAVKMRKEYQNKAEECNLAVDLFRRNKANLDSYLASLPPEGVKHPDLDTRARIKELRKTIKAELAEVNENLEFFTEIQSKLSMIVQQIDKAGKQSYESNFAGVQSRSFPIGTKLPGRVTDQDAEETTLEAGIREPAPIPVATTTHTNVQTQVGNGPLNFLLKEKLREGEIKVFDVTHHSTPVDAKGARLPLAPKVESFGRFTEQHSQLNQAGIVTAKDGEVTKVPAGKYEILKFPTAVDEGQSQADLSEAKVKFSMIMSAQILANLESPPTKDKPLTLTGENEEEMAYLYMAFKVQGVKHIQVNSGTFNPKLEERRLFGYHPGTRLEEVDANFKQHATHVAHIKTDLEKVNKEKFDPDAKSKAEKVMQIKGGLANLKNRAQEAIKKEGVAPVPEEITPSNTKTRI